jgi:hypothetical protein
MNHLRWAPALVLLAVPLLASRPNEHLRQAPTPTTGFIIILPSPTLPVIIALPSRTPTTPSSSVQTRTPTPTATPTLPSFAIASPTSTPLGFGAEMPPTPTPHGDPYFPDFGLTLPSPTSTPGSLTGPDLPQVDLSVTNLEVTQGLQSLDNDMPLMEVRMTYVRVYLRSFGGDWFPVHGVLQVWRDNDYLGMIGPENGPIPAFTGGGDRTNVDHTLNFRLPWSWRWGHLTLKAFIYSQDPQSPFTEEPIWVNNFREVEVDFHQGQGVSMSLWPIHLHQDYDGTKPEVTFTEDDPDTWTVLAGLERLLPVQAVYLHAAPIDKLYCASWSGGEIGVGLEGGPDVHGPCEFNLVANGGAQNVNATMALIDFLTEDNWDDVLNYGMVDPSFGGNMIFYNDQGIPINYTGLALYQQTHGLMSTSTWANTPWQMEGGETLAHEIGHRLGLSHVLCAGNEALGGALDDTFPWTEADCKIANLNPSGYYGFDVLYAEFPGLSGPTVISNDPSAAQPNQGFPLMGYQTPKWLDAYYWCAVLDALGVDCDKAVTPFLARGSGAGLMSLAERRPQAEEDAFPSAEAWAADRARQAASGYLLAVGQVDRTAGSGELRQVLQVPQIPDDDQRELLSGQGLFRAETPYSLVLVNDRGEVLASAPILDGSDAHDRMGVLGFVTALPFDPSATAVQLREGDRVLAERRTSAHAPQVALVSPNGGELLSAPLEIVWEATDTDGDPLDFTVQYSADGGQTWQALTVGHLGTSLRLESIDTLEGTEQGKIRVLASDGFLTGSDESDGYFSVPNSPPLAAITSPLFTSLYPVGATVVLSGSATDREDGILPAESLSWSSDVDGPLGAGSEVAVSSLSPGRHTITLTVRDSQGAEDRAQTAIGIDPAVVVRHLSDEDLQAVAGALAGHGAAGPGLPDQAAPATPSRWVALAIGAGLLILALVGAGLVALGLRRRADR